MGGVRVDAGMPDDVGEGNGVSVSARGQLWVSEGVGVLSGVGRGDNI